MPRQPSQSDTDSFLKQESHFSLSLRCKITWLIRSLGIGKYGYASLLHMSFNHGHRSGVFGDASSMSICAFLRLPLLVTVFTMYKYSSILYTQTVYIYLWTLCTFRIKINDFLGLVNLNWLNHAYTQQQGLPQQKASDISLEKQLVFCLLTY